MRNSLTEMQLCGLLPCLRAETGDALLAGAKALEELGFPCVEVDLASAGVKAALERLVSACPKLAVGVKAGNKEQAREAFALGAEWATMPAGAGWPEGERDRVFVMPEARTPQGKETEPGQEGGLFCCDERNAKWLASLLPSARFLISGCEELQRKQKWLANPQVLAIRQETTLTAEGARAQAMEIFQKWREQLGFSLVHVGVNGGNDAGAREIAQTFSRLLGMPYLEGEASNFAGTLIEVMKEGGRGAHGHIGIGTDDLARGMYFVRQAGFSFDPVSRKEDASGRPVLYYVDREIAGHAVHLLQK